MCASLYGTHDRVSTVCVICSLYKNLTLLDLVNFVFGHLPCSLCMSFWWWCIKSDSEGYIRPSCLISLWYKLYYTSAPLHSFTSSLLLTPHWTSSSLILTTRHSSFLTLPPHTSLFQLHLTPHSSSSLFFLTAHSFSSLFMEWMFLLLLFETTWAPQPYNGKTQYLQIWRFEIIAHLWC